MMEKKMTHVIEQIAEQELRTKYGNRYWVADAQSTGEPQLRSEGDVFTIWLAGKFEYSPTYKVMRSFRVYAGTGFFDSAPAPIKPARLYELTDEPLPFDVGRKIITGTI